VSVNGSRLGRLEVDAQPREQRLAVPAAPLFRGDNLLSLVVGGADDAGLEFHRLAVRATAEAGS
jgi:hypothetical protein